MTEHPITPPPNLRRLWAQEAQRMDPHDPVAWLEYVATQAARWGDGQRLEACCEWLREAKHHGLGYEVGAMLAGKLRVAMRPKPPSLAEQGLAELKEIMDELHEATGSGFTASAINAALRRLQELEQDNG